MCRALGQKTDTKTFIKTHRSRNWLTHLSKQEAATLVSMLCGVGESAEDDESIELIPKLIHLKLWSDAQKRLSGRILTSAR